MYTQYITRQIVAITYYEFYWTLSVLSICMPKVGIVSKASFEYNFLIDIGLTFTIMFIMIKLLNEKAAL